MKKYLFLLVLFTLFMNVNSVKASNDFDLEISNLYEVGNVLVVTYNTDIKSNDSDFSFWKIKLTCEEGIKGFVEGSSINGCNSTVLNHDISKDGGYIIFIKDDVDKDYGVRATVKFRAFDDNGTWLSSDRASVAF